MKIISNNKIIIINIIKLTTSKIIIINMIYLMISKIIIINNIIIQYKIYKNKINLMLFKYKYNWLMWIINNFHKNLTYNKNNKWTQIPWDRVQKIGYYILRE